MAVRGFTQSWLHLSPSDWMTGLRTIALISLRDEVPHGLDDAHNRQTHKSNRDRWVCAQKDAGNRSANTP